MNIEDNNGGTTETPQETYYGVAVTNTEVTNEGKIITGEPKIVVGSDIEKGKYIGHNGGSIEINDIPEEMIIPLADNNEKDNEYVNDEQGDR